MLGRVRAPGHSCTLQRLSEAQRVARIFRRSHLPAVVALSLFFGTNLVVSRFTLGQLHSLVHVAVRLPIAHGFDLSGVQWSGVVAIIYGSLGGTLLGFLLYSFLVARHGPINATQTEYIVTWDRLKVSGRGPE